MKIFLNMENVMGFAEFPKIARLSRECCVTEKIDGTNASVLIRAAAEAELEQLEPNIDTLVEVDGKVAYMRAGSRTRWISAADDNHGFAKWVIANAHELARLGIGNHFGEWWGQGIQRNYSQTKKRWSLFNTKAWADDAVRPACCDVVPILYQGIFDDHEVMKGVKVALARLREQGSAAAPGFMKPEGIIIWHVAAQMYFKKTLDRDEEWKGKSESDSRRHCASDA